jgi:hypothetical protein
MVTDPVSATLYLKRFQNIILRGVRSHSNSYLNITLSGTFGLFWRLNKSLGNPTLTLSWRIICFPSQNGVMFILYFTEFLIPRGNQILQNIFLVYFPLISLWNTNDIAIEQGDRKRSRDHISVVPSEAVPCWYMKWIWFLEVRLDLYDTVSRNVISKSYAQLGPDPEPWVREKLRLAWTFILPYTVQSW